MLNVSNYNEDHFSFALSCIIHEIYLLNRIKREKPFEFHLQSAFHDGKQPNWFHQECFFKKQRPASEALIDGFPKLRVEDQKEIRENLGK